MNYLVLEKCKHPLSKAQLNPGDVVNLFHTVGDKMTKGTKPFLRRSKASTKAQIIAQKHVAEQDGDKSPAKSS